MLIKIGTRGSKLALWQSEYIANLLNQAGIDTELVLIETKGDKILNQSLSKIGSKGLFTSELEEKLRDGSIDIAVHSAKDMQSTLDADLEIIAFNKREKVNDVLISFDKSIRLSGLNENQIVGTSSTRRIAMLLHYYPHIKTADIRGNLQTRMQKLQDGNYTAIILAYAGVCRMGLEEHIVEYLPLEQFTPAVGQGSIAIEAAKSLSSVKKETIRQLANHTETEICLLAERAYLKTLQGGCSIPVFGLATIENDQIVLDGGIISLDGQKMLSG